LVFAISMRQLTAALALASACILAGCSTSTGGKPAATGSPGVASATTTTTSAAPVAAGDLRGLTLGPAELNAALGAKSMAALSYGTDELADDSSDINNKDCVVLHDTAESAVYDGTGYVAVYNPIFQDDPDIQKAKYLLDEAAVSFPSASNAAKFFTASSQRWPACANQTYKYKTDTWTTGPVSNTNGVLSATTTQEGQDGWACQRALTVANNVAVDVKSCSYNSDDSAVTVAHQIAAKITAK
jgi:PknH-like extracellular domain